MNGALASRGGDFLKLIKNLADSPARRFIGRRVQQPLKMRDVHADDEWIVVGHSNPGRYRRRDCGPRWPAKHASETTYASGRPRRGAAAPVPSLPRL